MPELHPMGREPYLQRSKEYAGGVLDKVGHSVVWDRLMPVAQYLAGHVRLVCRIVLGHVA